jgi:hypothetical protein
MMRDPLREEEFESRWEAAPAVAFVIGLQVLLAVVSRDRGWKLWVFPWWAWLISNGPELALLIPLGFDRPRHRLEQLGYRRSAALALIGIVSLTNGILVLALLASLINGEEKSGGQLLFKAITVWSTNVVAFGLWFWGLDRGGPARRRLASPPPPDFLFPQLADGKLGEPGWYPRLLDYIYVSFTNSIAFSPTDVLPLTRWAKMLMLSESAISAVSILLVAARAVNIFK